MTAVSASLCFNSALRCAAWAAGSSGVSVCQDLVALHIESLCWKVLRISSDPIRSCPQQSSNLVIGYLWHSWTEHSQHRLINSGQTEEVEPFYNAQLDKVNKAPNAGRTPWGRAPNWWSHPSPGSESISATSGLSWIISILRLSVPLLSETAEALQCLMRKRLVLSNSCLRFMPSANATNAANEQTCLEPNIWDHHMTHMTHMTWVQIPVISSCHHNLSRTWLLRFEAGSLWNLLASQHPKKKVLRSPTGPWLSDDTSS